MVMAHKEKVNWESEVYDHSGLGVGRPEEGAAKCVGTHIWAAHMNTKIAIKSFSQGVNSFLP